MIAAPISRSADSGARGFIVVAVLWILAALAALVLVYLVYVTNTAVVVAVSTDRVQTEALATAAVELTAYQLTSAREDVRPTSGTFDAKIGAHRVSVIFRSEAARIDLNSASKELLAGFIAGFGANPSAAESYADRIIAWRSPATEDDAENSFYRTSGLAYVPRHAPFPSVEELWLVSGIPAVFVERMLPFVTVFSNLGTVNVADAAPQVVAALPGMIARVRFEMAASSWVSSRLSVSGRMSMKTGVAPRSTTAFAVDTKVKDGKITSSPGERLANSMMPRTRVAPSSLSILPRILVR